MYLRSRIEVGSCGFASVTFLSYFCITIREYFNLHQNVEENRKIEITHTRADGFRIFQVDGVWGAVAPNIDRIYAELFTEVPLPPSKANYVIENGQLIEINNSPTDINASSRESQCGISLSLPTAILVRDWLDSKIKELSEAIESDVSPD